VQKWHRAVVPCAIAHGLYLPTPVPVIITREAGNKRHTWTS